MCRFLVCDRAGSSYRRLMVVQTARQVHSRSNRTICMELVTRPERTDPIDAVAAHRALQSIALVQGTLQVVAAQAGMDEAVHDLLSRALKHAGVVSAVLHDVMLGLPSGTTAALAEDPDAQAARRFGVRTETTL